jgi:signal transduction histidine kinase
MTHDEWRLLRAQRSGITAKLDFATKPERLPMEIETALFRVLQESLTNVHRYSGSPDVSIRFEHQPEVVILEIADSGLGIQPELLNRLREASSESGVGLAGIRERLNDLNGKLEIESDGHGTSLRAIVPLPALAQSAQYRDCRQVALSAHADHCLEIS